jgi:hypothetical protein
MMGLYAKEYEKKRKERGEKGEQRNIMYFG